jgi:TRAP-type C4-dicarboxylate transport system substrate-binding protein
MRSLLLAAVAAAWAAAPVAARAEPVRLRISTVSPEGTAWTRELRAFEREIESRTHGEVQVKWYLGAIAGDDLTALERVRHAQLDGIGGSVICATLAPSMRVTRVVGLFRSRDEVEYVMGRLKPLFDEEFRKAGFTNLVDGIFGADVLFSRRPVRTMAEFRADRWWVWNGWSTDTIWLTTLHLMGVRSVAASLDELAPAWERRQVDAFIAIPSVALAFQWSPMASYFTDAPLAMLPGCLVVANSAIDPLPLEQQKVIHEASAKLGLRWADITATQDQLLITSLFEKQGLKKVPMSQQFRAEFMSAAKQARERAGNPLVRRELLERVEALLAEYRAGRAQRQ